MDKAQMVQRLKDLRETEGVCVPLTYELADSFTNMILNRIGSIPVNIGLNGKGAVFAEWRVFHGDETKDSHITMVYAGNDVPCEVTAAFNHPSRDKNWLHLTGDMDFEFAVGLVAGLLEMQREETRPSPQGRYDCDEMVTGNEPEYRHIDFGS